MKRFSFSFIFIFCASILYAQTGGLYYIQNAEGNSVHALSITPASLGQADAGVDFWSEAYSNHGSYYDQLFVIGYNPEAYKSPKGGGTTSQPSLVEGFEEQFYNTTMGKYTYEWYINYQSADHTTIQNFRPFYAAIARESNTDHTAYIDMDIGGSSGILRVLANGVSSTEMLRITSSQVETKVGFGVNLNGASVVGVGGSIVVKPPTASEKGITVRGLTSQSGDLNQWQDSSGSIIGRIKSDGSPEFATYKSQTKSGLTINGIICTITEITGGIITAASCS